MKGAARAAPFSLGFNKARAVVFFGRTNYFLKGLAEFGRILL